MRRTFAIAFLSSFCFKWVILSLLAARTSITKCWIPHCQEQSGFHILNVQTDFEFNVKFDILSNPRYLNWLDVNSWSYIRRYVIHHDRTVWDRILVVVSQWDSSGFVHCVDVIESLELPFVLLAVVIPTGNGTSARIYNLWSHRSHEN